MRKEMYDIDRRLIKTRKKSMHHAKSSKIVSRKNIRERENKEEKIFTLKCYAITILCSVALVLSVKVVSDIIYKADLMAATAITTPMIEEYLMDEGLAYYGMDNKFFLKYNSVEDYEQLELDGASLGTIYVYQKAFNDNCEFDKLVESIDSDYEDYNFASKEFFDEAIKEVVKAYRDDNLDNIVYNNVNNNKVLKK